MVSTRQMSTTSGVGGIPNATISASSVDEGNYLRPSVVTRQSHTLQTNGVNSMSPSSNEDSMALSDSTTAATTSAIAATSVGFISTIQTATTSVRQAQALKSSSCTSSSSVGASRLQQQQKEQKAYINLLDLPEELMDKILSYVGYKKIAQLRVVSQKMNDVCMHILNSTFSKLITKTFNRFQAIKANMPRRESARRNHPLACECDITETCYMRLSLLQMTFGKHIERGHCCFFPGAILDEVYTILYYINNTPRVERPFRVTDELFDLSTMAMEYFRDRIEPTLPGIAYYNKDIFKLPTTTKRPLVIASDLSESNSSLPSPPQSNMVLRKGIRKIKQGMKIYNNQLSVLRNELRTCKRKSAEQGKQIAEQQKLLAEQRKQTMEYANRLDENDKKNEEMSRKFSTLLQELNKCKTELQYWRSKSPAIPTCISCGHRVAPTLPAEDFQALVNQGIKPEDIILNMDDDTDAESDISMNDSGCNTMSLCNEFVFPDETTTAKLLAVNTASKNLKRQHHSAAAHSSNVNNANLIADNETELTQFINYNHESNNGPSAFIATAGYSPRLFYGSSSSSASTSNAASSSNLPFAGNEAQHKSVIVSPQSQRYNDINNSVKVNSNASQVQIEDTGDSIARKTNNEEYQQECGNHNNNNNNTEDVNSLQAISSHETKKARRVQKHARCVTNTSGKRK